MKPPAGRAAISLISVLLILTLAVSAAGWVFGGTLYFGHNPQICIASHDGLLEVAVGGRQTTIPLLVPVAAAALLLLIRLNRWLQVQAV